MAKPKPLPPVRPKPRPSVRPKPPVKPRANASKLMTKPGGSDYMKPVGGTKQKGYVAPGGSLFDVKADRKKSYLGFDSVTRRTGKGVGEPKASRYETVGQVKTGVNPAAMRATSGNPKPTTAQLVAGKKASDKAKAMAKAKPKLKPTPSRAKAPTTGKYKRGNP